MILSILCPLIAVLGFGWLVHRMIHVIREERKESALKCEKLYSEQQEEDFEWFLAHYDELYKTYGECYFAICKKRIIGIYPTYADGVHGAQERGYKLGTFIVQHCNGEESGYKVWIM